MKTKWRWNVTEVVFAIRSIVSTTPLVVVLRVKVIWDEKKKNLRKLNYLCLDGASQLHQFKIFGENFFVFLLFFFFF